ncbi:MAG: substrate-binding domain-containing protein [Betaproteobacteria bacterium]
MTNRIPLSAALVAAALVLGAAPAGAAELKLLVSPEIEAAVEPLVAAFERETRHTVDLDTGGKAGMRRAGDRGGTADVIVAPAGRIDQMIKRGNALAAGRHDVGRVGLGVFVRDGARVPAIGTSDELQKSLVAAAGVVYGDPASESGRQVEKLIRSLGLDAELQMKTSRPAGRDQVAGFMLRSRGDDIGIAPVTEILANVRRGLKFVGPVPADLQDYTPFAAAALRNAATPDAARAFLDYLAAPAAKAKLAAAGIVE